MLRRVVVATVLGAALCAAPPALATTYTVTAAAGEGGVCQGTNCPSLRAAFTQAAGSAGGNAINLPVAGTYTLTQGPLSVSLQNLNLTITGADARQTTIQGTSTQIFVVAAGATLQLNTLTVTGGTSSQASGGNIQNQGTLTLDRVRVAGGSAPLGGGIANLGGVATITNSLIDDNTATDPKQGFGGGILNEPGPASGVPVRGSLTVQNSTIGFNHTDGPALGGGIATVGNPTQTSLTAVTVARNTAAAGSAGAGLYDNSGGNVGVQSITASIVADNTAGTTPVLADCGGLKPISSGQNISTSSTCGFSTTADPLLDTQPTNQGGQTDVFLTLAGSPARRLVASCPVASDQRGVARALGGVCDAGAYESPAPTPQPQPQPTPTPTPTPPPVPVFHKSVVVTRVSGTVKVRLPGTNKFVDISGVQGIPLGATIDVTHGKINLTSVPKAGGKPQTALFYGGMFKITQQGAITELTLNQPLSACPRAHAAAAAAAKKKPKTRSLWGDGHGSFRTTGRYSAATVRGTKWFVEDSCAGTLTKVAHGVVSVRDTVKHKTITLRAGKKYLARPRRH